MSVSVKWRFSDSSQRLRVFVQCPARQAEGVQVVPEEDSDWEEAGQQLLAVEGEKRVQRFRRCALCEQDLKGLWLECSCGSQSHVDCLAHHFLEASFLPLTLLACKSWSLDSYRRWAFNLMALMEKQLSSPLLSIKIGSAAV